MHQAKMFFLVAVGVFLFAGAYRLLAVAPAQAQSKPSAGVVRSGSSGRWVIVNGTPELSRNIMLLDTQTGASWVSCDGEGGERLWCYITRTLSGTADSDTVK